MEVTKNNFNEAFDLVQESIKTADFLVIDCEFTGLLSGRDVSIFDTPEDYYTRLLEGSSNFLLIQFGLSAFKWDHDKQCYFNESYNFYLFPKGKADRTFLCQSSSLEFLMSQGFDFNKMIRDGISFVTEPLEEKLRDSLRSRKRSYAPEKDDIPIPDENKQQIEDICKKVREFLDENKSNEMEVDRCNSFIRRLLFQELGSRFKNEVFLETKILDNKSRVLNVIRVTPENEHNDRESLRRRRDLQEFDETIGFSRIAKMISASEKLIVGHNMLLDVLHTMGHFFRPPPTNYRSFKGFAHCMFPWLLDTKYMSSLPPFKDKLTSTVLSHLLATLSEEPFTKPVTEAEVGRGYTQTDNKLHEAGFDAYITGLCFLSMYRHLSKMRGENELRVAEPSAPIFKPFVNKMFLLRTAYQDSPYMNLDGDDPSPNRDHVFYLIFPREWYRSDINQLFSPFGPITVQFVDEVSALIALSRKDQARDVFEMVSKEPECYISTYAQYKGLVKAQDKEKKKSDDSPESLVVRSVPDLNTRLLQSAAASPPVKVDRKRINSVSIESPTTPTGNRKRTSSGVFQIDHEEPPAKKSEISTNVASVTARTYSQVTKTPVENVKIQEKISNGRRKVVEKSQSVKKTDSVVSKVMEKFDSDITSKCVTAFKESDSWD